MDYEFGISLDASAVTQRHTLYDSDEEENDIKNPEEIFHVTDTSGPTPDKSGCILLITVGQAASIFVRSYCVVDDTPVSRITSAQPTVIKDKYFSDNGGDSDQSVTISEVYSPKTTDGCDGKYFVCVQEKQLKSEYLNIWCSKVRTVQCKCLCKTIRIEETIMLLIMCKTLGNQICSTQSCTYSHISSVG